MPLQLPGSGSARALGLARVLGSHGVVEIKCGWEKPVEAGLLYLNSPKLQIRLLALLLTGLTRRPPLPSPNPELVDPPPRGCVVPAMLDGLEVLVIKTGERWSGKDTPA